MRWTDLRYGRPQPGFPRSSPAHGHAPSPMRPHSPPRIDSGIVDLGAVLDGPGEDLLVRSPSASWTRRELVDAADAEARTLADVGVSAGVVHPMDARPEVQTLVTLLALWRLGAVPALLNPGLTRPEWTVGVQALSKADRGGAVPPGTAAILWTSGTSGRPRGVALGHAGLIASAEAAAERLSLGSDDVWLASLSPAHVGGLALMTRALLLGSTLVLRGKTRPEEIPALLRGAPNRPPVTHLSLVPTQLQRLLDAWGDDPPPRSFRLALIGGARTPGDLAERAFLTGWPVALTYGMTEMTSQVATAAPAEVLYDPEAVGRPLRDVEIKIDASGEIWTRGPTRALAYLGTDELLVDVEGWVHTGDLGELDASGRLRVTGRRSDRILSGGVTVDAHEVEAALRAHPGVAAAAVVGLPDAEWGERVAAVIAPHPGSALDVAALDDWCRSRLSVAKVPRVWRIVDSVPLNANGKVDRPGLRELFG